MSIFTKLSRYAREKHERRLRIRTYMQISSLPNAMRKDIGWPDADGPDERIPHPLDQACG